MTFPGWRAALAGSMLLACGSTTVPVDPTVASTQTTRSGHLSSAVDDASPRLRSTVRRVLHTKVNLRAPIEVETRSGEIFVTFGRRGRERVRLSIDPDTLAIRSTTTFMNAERPRPGVVLASAFEPIRVVFEQTGDVLELRTDPSTRRVMAQRLGWADSKFPVSSASAEVMSAPRAASLDGRRVIAFFIETTDDDGYALVATAIDTLNAV
jgi:hypothetical protein